MMALEKDTNFDAKMGVPGKCGPPRESCSRTLGAPLEDSRFQRSETRNQMSGYDRCQKSVIILLARLRPFAGSGHGGGFGQNEAFSEHAKETKIWFSHRRGALF